jgi:5-methylcytosine-specific restriction enzyme A
MPAIKYYDSAKHRRWREAVLHRASYLCEECARYGKRTPATVAHHRQTVEDHPELRLDVGNGEALCDACHNRMHPEKGGRMW